MLFGLVLALAAPLAASRPLTANERRMIETAVREQLSDPDSAIFRHNPYMIGAKIYCGHVNSKNRFGGYVGYRLFRINVTAGKAGALPADGEYGVPSIASNDDSEMGSIVEALRERSCAVQGYKVG